MVGLHSRLQRYKGPQQPTVVPQSAGKDTDITIVNGPVDLLWDPADETDINQI